MTETIAWPKKTRELHNHHFDSTIWNDFRFRNNDIIIATYATSGTTWMQQIVAQMLFGPDPYLDLRIPPEGRTMVFRDTQYLAWCPTTHRASLILVIVIT